MYTWRPGICQMYGNEAMLTWYSNPGGKLFTWPRIHMLCSHCPMFWIPAGVSLTNLCLWLRMEMCWKPLLFYFPFGKWSESLSNDSYMRAWPAKWGSKTSYKMTSAHCTYLLSADISLTFKYKLVTSLWAWYCSESNFWLEHGGTTLLGHRKSNGQVRCRASGLPVSTAHSLGSLALLFLANGAVNVGKKKANLSHQENKWPVLLWKVHVNLNVHKTLHI